ncbi:MAG: hypothetical protein ACUVV0_16855 [Anaerolineae bacterium]
MDLAQLSQMVSWMDEERRRDKADLARFEQKLESYSVEMTEQARKIQDLESRLAGAQVQLAKLAQVDKALEQFKNEIMLLLREYNERYQEAEREAALLRQTDRDAQTRAINELRRELQNMPNYADELQARKAEEQRLSELAVRLQRELAALNKNVEECARSITYLEERTNKDSRRIAELQQQIAELFKQSEVHLAKIQVLEEMGLRYESRMNELQEARQERSQEWNRFLEMQRLAEQQRQRQMAEWAAEVEAQRKRMEEYAARMRAISEQYELNRRALGSLQELEAHLKQEQNRLAELQRLAEERQKRQMDEWEAAQERTWKKYEDEMERRWEEQERYNAQFPIRLEEIQKHIEENRSQIESLWKVHQEHAYHQMLQAQNWAREFERLLNGEK